MSAAHTHTHSVNNIVPIKHLNVEFLYFNIMHNIMQPQLFFLNTITIENVTSISYNSSINNTILVTYILDAILAVFVLFQQRK